MLSSIGTVSTFQMSYEYVDIFGASDGVKNLMTMTQLVTSRHLRSRRSQTLEYPLGFTVLGGPKLVVKLCSHVIVS